MMKKINLNGIWKLTSMVPQEGSHESIQIPDPCSDEWMHMSQEILMTLC